MQVEPAIQLSRFLPDMMARQEASILKESTASFSQAPWDSATSGIRHQPKAMKALHFGSFSVCFRSSVDKGAPSADNPLSTVARYGRRAKIDTSRDSGGWRGKLRTSPEQKCEQKCVEAERQ